MKKGFTLVEILIVMTLIGILAAIAIPNFSKAGIRGKETVLRKNLHEIREAIQNFYLDKKKYPTSLEDLVTNRYLRAVPYDPITKTNDWNPIHFEPQDMDDYESEDFEGIIDVKSLSTGIALDGSRYNEW